MPSQAKTVSSQSITKLTGFFDGNPEKVIPYLERLMGLSLEIIKAKVSQYPPATEANFPGRVDKEGKPLGYYERGKGSWRPIKSLPHLKQHVALNQAGVSLGRGVRVLSDKAEEKVLDRVLGYKLNPTSEQLGKNWTTEVRTNTDGVTGNIGNPTSYAEHVQGFLDEQAKIPASRAWMSIETAIEDSMPEILELADQALGDFVNDNFPEDINIG
jgi:hypothetical protein